jgi:hypothetical protein
MARTYDFWNKPAHEITDEFMAIIDNNGTRTDMRDAYAALLGATTTPQAAFVYHKVVADLEKKIITRAKLDAAAWQKNKWVVVGSVEHLRPLAEAFVQIFQYKREGAQRWTKTFATEFSSMSALDQDSYFMLGECFANVSEKMGDAPRPVAAAVADNIAASNQQKLKKLAARHKARLIGAPGV